MELNIEQQAAVTAGARSVLVIAGAGSGKTRVLTERIAYLTEKKKVSAYDILAITFTRKAAGEMRERLERRIGNAAHMLIMGTMHATALKLIKRFGEAIGLRAKNVTVYSEWESEFMIKEIARDLGLFKKSWKIPKKDIDRMFADYYERGIVPEQETHGDAFKVFSTFIARCKENNALPYGSLLIGLDMLIPTIRRYLNIKHIMVDECQDLDPLQWKIINSLCEAFGADLFVVGDIDQSIYEFRGAVPQYLYEHQNDFTIYQLQNNYRSDARIVNSANKLIANNLMRVEKIMQPVRPEGESVSVHKDMDSSEIAAFILGYPVSAVLARNHFLLEALTRELSNLDIPHEYIGQKTKITNTEEFRRFHAFLKLMVNPYDNFSFLMIKDLMNLDPEEYALIRLQAVIKHMSHFQVWHDRAPLIEDEYAGFFDSDLFRKSLASAAIMIKYAATGALPFHEPGWGMDINPAFAFIFSWLSDHPNGTIEEYLDWLAVYDVQDEITERSTGKLQILTVHAAKGLEWPSVIIAGCNEGILPSSKADKNGEIESERRLMYVAMTRAMDRLFLMVRPEVKESEFTGKVYNNPISRFCREAV